jgi:nicotinamidase-related amidase
MATRRRSGNEARRRPANLGAHRCRAALLLIDVINRFDFDGGDALLRSTRPMAEKLAALKARAARAGMPVVYVNDNFGRWRSDFRAIVQHCSGEDNRGRDVVERLAPVPTDYFVLKPSNSAFYASVLETLLRDFETETLVLTGVATDNCVLFTAHDAYLRGFRLFVPEDCVAAESAARSRQALQIIARSMKGDTRASGRLRLGSLVGASRR